VFELVESKQPTPYRLGGMPKGISLNTWAQCVGCSQWLVPIFSLDATAEFPLGDKAGLVAMACTTGCGNPDTKWSVARVHAATKREWGRAPKRTPHDGKLLPQRYATLRQVKTVKIPSLVCGCFGCKLERTPLVAYRYRPKQLAVIAMCSEHHPGEWIDSPPLKGNAFKGTKAWREKWAGLI
jgi:hypothetical protein